ncbi:RteC domain-containing protein [Flavobacterium sp. xlx-214]|uniref:RteC domain-containing protein n=1 Tax=unclassified Flavobacterium TaxID=196869 RepID=UPI0013D34B7B|nr:MULTISPECIES: RteC domain-containing protein [unclassified Flavobacterium]MBA5792689.1 RteC domain-containing protein [Flavobacterium sp. xlx-221]QMI83834.1 RteC domain-containing protein [Flavobacterium sp. xlx-214]
MIHTIHHLIEQQTNLDVAFDYFSPEQLCFIKSKVLELECLLHTIHSYIRTYSFKNIQEEILFFKELKPMVVKEYIFMIWLQKIHLQSSHCTLYKKDLLKKQLQKTKKLFKTERFFYGYIKGEQTMFDAYYFTRLQEQNLQEQDYYINFDHKISCSHGYLKAKLLAHEKMQYCCADYLMGKPELVKEIETIPITTELKWTATKVEAVELLYALYYAGVFNNGTASVQQIAKLFDCFLEGEMGKNIYRDFVDVKNRKINTTKFLDKLSNGLKLKIAEELK